MIFHASSWWILRRELQKNHSGFFSFFTFFSVFTLYLWLLGSLALTARSWEARWVLLNKLWKIQWRPLIWRFSTWDQLGDLQKLILSSLNSLWSLALRGFVCGLLAMLAHKRACDAVDIPRAVILVSLIWVETYWGMWNLFLHKYTNA